MSIIMAVYNTENYLECSIKSVINQTYLNWELICVNDGSTDNSYKILSEFASRDGRIKLFDQPNCGIASKVRNIALQYVGGEYVFVLDSDDYISKECLSNCVQRAIDTDSDCVMPDMHMIDSDSKILRLFVGIDGDREIILDPKSAVEQSMEWNISGLGLWKTALVNRFGYDTSGMNGDEYSTRLFLLNSNKVTFCDGIYYYLIHQQSTTRNFSLKVMDVYSVSFKLIKLLQDNDFTCDVINRFKLTILKDIVFRYSKYLKNKKHLTNEQILRCEGIVRQTYDSIVTTSTIRDIKQLGSMTDKILLTVFYPNYSAFLFWSKSYNILGNLLNPIFKSLLKR